MELNFDQVITLIVVGAFAWLVPPAIEYFLQGMSY